MFPPMPYLDWIVGRPAAATFDLGSSDLRRTASSPPSETVPAVLDGIDDPPAETTLETQIATRYGVSEDRVLVTAGATHANLVAVATALGLASDGPNTAESPEVLVERPGYQPLVRTPRAFGARVSRFARPASEEYRLVPERVSAAFDDELALVTVTNRHNPSGRLAPRETLAELAENVADAGAYLLVDEVYAPFVSAEDGQETGPNDGPRPFGGVTAAGLPNTVVTGSLTKFYGLGGLKIGWLVGPTEFVARARQALLHVPAVASPSRALARRALHNEATLTEHARAMLARNHDRLATFVAERSDLSGEVHDGSSYAFVSHDAADGDVVSAAAWDAGILVVPGRFFDDTASFRLSLGRAPEEVGAGLDAFGAVLDEL
ncbi:aminotransferase class I/II [Haloprofundus marisrubri]|uniref:Aminotransferase class I/II n=1 Tax=Haloprofundus marisrubri TaxID=1514971 RepID=A0A0W1RDM3_9EURY|nr:pyridoxal phosphate-dependent aminotransferase [Haloprofundus marisrubri]KTG11223.1 aminotransferase class I/II [Haloprofundus marisrubri]